MNPPAPATRISLIGLLAAAALAVGGAEQAAAKFEYAFTMGAAGKAPGQFFSPWGIAVGGDNQVFVADTGNHRVQRFDAALGNPFAWEATFGPLYHPEDVAVSRADGSVYVADTSNSRVVRSNAQGEGSWQVGGTVSAEDGRFDNPRGVAVSVGGESVYVADSRNNRVQRLRTSDGAFVSKWGSLGKGPGQFAVPADVAVAPDGSVYVTDEYNHRVQKFDANGAPLLRFGANLGDGSMGTAPGSFSFPDGVSVDRDGDVYVAEPSPNARVQIFDKGGVYVDAVRGEGTPAGAFSPHDVAVLNPLVGSVLGARGRVVRKRLYVLDTENRRVVVFDELDSDPNKTSGVPVSKIRQSGSSLSFSIRCPAEASACNGTATLRSAGRLAASARKRVVAFGSRRYSVAGGKSKRLRIRFSRAGRRALARRGRVKARLVLKPNDAAGKVGATTKRVTLKAPRG